MRAETPARLDFPVVVIATSGRDPKPLITLFVGLGPQSHVATLIVPTDDAPLPRALSQQLVPARAGDPVAAGRVYALPPRGTLQIAGGLFARGAAPFSVLASLARSSGPSTVVVVLSSAGLDALDGLRALKGAGATVLVQDPSSATIDALPRAAAAAGLAHRFVGVQTLGEEAARRVLRLETRDEGASPTADLWSRPAAGLGLRRLVALVKSRLGVELSGYKSATLQRRVERRMAAEGFDTVEAFVDHLHDSGPSLRALHDELFIHVTKFFRDPDAFEAVRAHALPRLIDERTNHVPVRVWVPGCSTGEEAYSLGILLAEQAAERGLPLRLQLFATDISEAAVRQARSGVYAEPAMENVSAQRRERFFEPTPGGWKVRKELRERCVFARHDLATDPPIAHVDLISCRNVLIYFQTELQKRVIPILHYALEPGRFLWLGPAESPGDASKLFSTVDGVHRIYAKLAAGLSSALLGEVTRPPALGLLSEPDRPLPRRPGPQRSADELVLFRYGPPGVVVDADLEIVQYRGNSAPFLSPPNDASGRGLIEAAHPQLRRQLRTLCRAARRDNLPARGTDIPFAPAGVRRRGGIAIEVTPIDPLAEPKDRRYLVAFERGSPAREAAAPSRTTVPLAELKLELDSLRENQLVLREQFESSQEELTCANEELQSTNEELLSSNEELEAAKGELQASNEELVSLNGELQVRNLELSAVNDSLARGEDRFRVMVESVNDYAIYMLDPTGRVTSWNEGARRMKGYETAEIVGKHFSHFFTPEDVQAHVPELELERARADGRLDVVGWRVRKDGSRFWASVVIARMNDAKGGLIGFAKVTRDLTESRRAEDALRHANEALEARVAARTRELEMALASRDEFLSIASHELKTPLTGLKLQLQLGRRGLKTGRHASQSEVLDALERSLKQAGALEELVEDLLDISRIQTGRLVLDAQPVNIAELVDEVVGRFVAQFAQAQTPLEVERYDRATVATWDRRRVGQVLANLLSNALKYAPRAPVKVSAKPDGDSVRLKVKDAGRGIPPEKRAVIFDRFERAGASTSIGGLGLGLFISRRIVEAHGGTLSVESPVGEGACFIVDLPREVAQS